MGRVENIKRRLRRPFDRLYFLYEKRLRRWGYRLPPVKTLLDLWPRKIALWRSRGWRAEDAWMKKRQRLLQEVLRPVPSRVYVAGRYVTVAAVVWLGLMAGDALLYRAGRCVLECENNWVNATIWALLALAGGVMAIWNMHQARARHARARQLLLNKGVIMRDVWNGAKLGATLVYILFIGGLFVAAFFL